MRFKLVMLMLFVSLFAWISPVFAQEKVAEKKDLSAAYEFLEAAQFKVTFDESVKQTIDMQIKSNPLIAQYREVMLKFLLKYMSWDSLKDEIASIYASEFTTQELKELTAFYKTPVGKKASLLLPRLMNKGGELGMKKVQEHSPELKKMLEEESIRLKDQQKPVEPAGK
ncbi:MAG TPA: DUF2059 domain-containing protein [bacterium]|nr:DUF2059 domain-containing protein [bacterium]